MMFARRLLRSSQIAANFLSKIADHPFESAIVRVFPSNGSMVVGACPSSQIRVNPQFATYGDGIRYAPYNWQAKEMAY